MSFLDNDDNTQQIELLEVERHAALDLTVRNWFVFTALENAGNHLAPVAFANYQKALNRYCGLYTGVLTEVLYEKVETAKVEKFYGDYATLTLGEKAQA
jgi:hypothetical protein